MLTNTAKFLVVAVVVLLVGALHTNAQQQQPARTPVACASLAGHGWNTRPLADSDGDEPATLLPGPGVEQAHE
jgi:hypothetical protein